MLVLFRHQIVLPERSGFLFPLTKALLNIGWTGVDLFFVLSGFLVGGLLFNEIKRRHGLSSGRFIVRRGLKIWPSYFFYLACLVPILMHRWKNLSFYQAVRSILPNLLHVQNYFNTPPQHTWSLAVEEHFYLALPLVLYLLVKYGKKPIRKMPGVLAICISLVVMCNIGRLIAASALEFEQRLHVFPTHLRIDGLFFGVMLSYLYNFKREALKKFAEHRIVLILAGICLISPMMFLEIHEFFVVTFGFTFLYVGYGLILLALQFSPVDEGVWGRFYKSRIARGMAFIGFYSYSIYLWHFNIFQSIYERFKFFNMNIPGSLFWVLLVTGYILIAVFIGVISGILVERPFLAIRDRIYPSRAKALDNSGE